MKLRAEHGKLTVMDDATNQTFICLIQSIPSPHVDSITELPPTILGPTAANCRAVRMAGEEMEWSKWHFPPEKITFV
jgi:hypothetical protein